MKKVLAVVLASFLLLIIPFKLLGGTFDRIFWLSFIPGLMGNLAIAAVAIFVIDSLFKRERWQKLEQINAKQSAFVLFLSNRSAYWLLEYLGQTNEEEIKQDKTMNFEFAIAKIRNTDLAQIFYEKLQGAADREAFVAGFAKNVSDSSQGISKALETIYPHPDPEIKALADDLMHSSGALEALKGILEAIKEANIQVSADQQLNPHQIDLIIQIACGGKPTSLKK